MLSSARALFTGCQVAVLAKKRSLAQGRLESLLCGQVCTQRMHRSGHPTKIMFTRDIEISCNDLSYSKASASLLRKWSWFESRFCFPTIGKRSLFTWTRMRDGLSLCFPSDYDILHFMPCIAMHYQLTPCTKSLRQIGSKIILNNTFLSFMRHIPSWWYGRSVLILIARLQGSEMYAVYSLSEDGLAHRPTFYLLSL